MTSPLPPKSPQVPSIIRARIHSLMTRHDCKNYRELGSLLGIDFGYLHCLASGAKDNPSPTVLAKLGLRRVISYERIQES